MFGAGDPTLSPEEYILNKRNRGKSSRASWILPALVAFGIAALAVGAVVLSVNPGGQSSGSDLGQRPYVGGDLHSIAVDPTDPEKVMVGGHDGGAVSEDGGESWEPVGEGLPDRLSVVAVAQSDPQVVYAGALGAEGVALFRSEDGGKSWRAHN